MSNTPCPADLPSTWRAKAATLAPYSEPAARAFEQAARELETALGAEGDDLLTLTEAARVSGYSADHLGRLLKRGSIPNAGRAHAPRIRRADLPRRAGRLPCEPAGPMLTSAGQVARAVVSSENRR